MGGRPEILTTSLGKHVRYSKNNSVSIHAVTCLLRLRYACLPPIGDTPTRAHTNGLDGSSGGSAVCVAANIVPISIGTETDTSIIGPANISGVVGIKPTVGLTSRSGVIPISETFDTVGPFGRTVHDAVIALNAIVQSDDRDPATKNPSRVQERDYTTFLADRSALKGARFGLPWKRCWEFVPHDQMEVANEVLDAMREVGAEITWTDLPCAEDRIRPDGMWDW